MTHAVIIQFFANDNYAESEREFANEVEATDYAKEVAGQLAQVHLEANDNEYFDWDHNPDSVTVMAAEIYVTGDSYYSIAVTK